MGGNEERQLQRVREKLYRMNWVIMFIAARARVMTSSNPTSCQIGRSKGSPEPDGSQ